MQTFCCVWAASFWRSRNGGATTLKGSSRTAPSWAETAGKGDVLIHERSIFQVKAIRRCFSARSTASAGKPTLASTKLSWTISWRTDSGQASASAVRATSNGGGPAGFAGWAMRIGPGTALREEAAKDGRASGVAPGGGGVVAAVMVLRIPGIGTGAAG